MTTTRSGRDPSPRALTAHRLRVPRRRAFTLLEMLIVLFIIGMLAALLVPRLMGQVGENKANVAKAYIAQLSQSVEQFRLDNGRYPTDAEGLPALIKAPQGLTTWTKPYWDKRTLPKDPWKRDFIYKTDAEFGFIIRTLGADGKEGGEGENADLDNRS